MDIDKISAIPIIPILPAKAVRIVLVFFVIRLLRLRLNAVKNDIDVFFFFVLHDFLSVKESSSVFVVILSSSPLYGLLSSVIVPSRSLIILVEYCVASSGLCVTIIISLSFEISFSKSIIWILVCVSSAPVGSSARSISGSLTSALAIATLCICPPDI